MAILEIRKYGDPVLREKAAPVNGASDDLRAFLHDMAETMYAANGIGLAANQVGDLRRVLVIDPGEEERDKRPARTPNPQFFLNPEILDSSTEDGPYTEGCLSIPELEGEVYRPLKIRLRWTTLDGETREADFDGITSRVLQHEIDHLDGILFIDHMGTVKRKLLAGKLNKLRRETEARMAESRS
ncbi:MAG: peptide deformylase [Sumerlaeia bacterium]